MCNFVFVLIGLLSDENREFWNPTFRKEQRSWVDIFENAVFVSLCENDDVTVCDLMPDLND